MNDLYKLNMLLKEMNWMAKEVHYLLSDLSKNEKVDKDCRDAFDNWYNCCTLFHTELIEAMKEYIEAIIEEMEEE